MSRGATSRGEGRRRAAWAAWAGIWLALAATAAAQRMERAPDELAGVGVDERLDAPLPLDLEFLNESGAAVRLGDFFGARPVILSLTYSDCPMLCHLQLDGLVDALRAMPWSPGEQLEIVNVSIDAAERWQQARKTKLKHIEAYGRPETAAGWHFLVGENVKQLSDAVGFRYRYIAEQKQYVHTAALMICTPDGRLSRYLYGVQYAPQTLRLSLVEAGQGKVGSTYDRVLLFCFHYDAEAGRYGPAARRIMQLGGGLTLAALLIGLAPYWLRGRRRPAGARAGGATSAGEAAAPAPQGSGGAQPKKEP